MQESLNLDKVVQAIQKKVTYTARYSLERAFLSSASCTVANCTCSLSSPVCEELASQKLSRLG